MKTFFYPRLALLGIRKNKKLYLPYLLTCIGMVMMLYIVTFLGNSDLLQTMRGGYVLQAILHFGVIIIAVFAAIFLFYSNSFLTRRRKKEFGLYNILGMSKHNIGHILLWEAFFIAVVSILLGLLCGIALSKAAELFMVRLVGGKVSYTFSVSPLAVILTVVVFCAVFLLLFLFTLISVHRSGALNLLRSENSGEKPPRANWFFGIAGFIILAVAYVIALRVKNPVAAMTLFFLAVLLVIIGTYLLFIAGSVLLCRLLQKNKRYYYKTNHFVSVSGMVYRMKRNGAGLASICIIITMVLVMISTTSCLYFGLDNSVTDQYPREIMVQFGNRLSPETVPQELLGKVESITESEAERMDIAPKNRISYNSVSLHGWLKNDRMDLDAFHNTFDANAFSSWEVILIPLEHYNAITGENETLKQGEALVYSELESYTENTLNLTYGENSLLSYQVVKKLPKLWSKMSYNGSVLPILCVIVPDFSHDLSLISASMTESGRYITLICSTQFDTGLSKSKQIEFYDRLTQNFTNKLSETLPLGEEYHYSLESRAAIQADLMALNASFFFLGILLSFVLLLAAVLIIYYKQISEGYEDASRFSIMQKVGMSDREIRKSINSQLLTVFFTPLLMAGVHLAFAFPILQKMLTLFTLDNIPFLIFTTVLSFICFALFYILTYKITANAYYSIVSNNESKKS